MFICLILICLSKSVFVCSSERQSYNTGDIRNFEFIFPSCVVCGSFLSSESNLSGHVDKKHSRKSIHSELRSRKKIIFRATKYLPRHRVTRSSSLSLGRVSRQENWKATKDITILPRKFGGNLTHQFEESGYWRRCSEISTWSRGRPSEETKSSLHQESISLA